MIEIVSVGGIAMVQDGGRPGHMHEGVPPGGPLVPELLARANACARNAAGAAAIEAFGAITLAARAPLLLGLDVGETISLEAGQRRTIVSSGARVLYVAVRGGLDVPPLLGGRGTLPVAGLGGHEGRALRRGDLLPVGSSPAEDPSGTALAPPPDVEAAVRVVLGPDRDRFDAAAVDVLLRSLFVIDGRSDRVGIRLAGARISAAPDPSALSAPMVRGAIQVPPSGEPIVLGPDHPTTGGYPVIATVAHAHFGSLAARPVGARVHFVT